MLRGVDIFSGQADIKISALSTTDFVIVKATQGVSYVNPYYSKQYADAKAAGKLLGVYHYAGGNDPVREARFFWSKFQPHRGEAIPALDWEGLQNNRFSQGPNWVRPFVEEFYKLSGVYPLIYMSKGVCRSHNWSWIAARCGLWCAQYANYRNTDYNDHPWTDSKGTGAWSVMTIYQYSSRGRITGYARDLDINVAYLDKDAWMRIARGDKKVEEEKKTINWFPGNDDDHDYIIKSYQSVLAGRGYYTGNIDGIWGNKSQTAAKAFQQDSGIDVNGIMNADTVLRLFGLEDK